MARQILHKLYLTAFWMLAASAILVIGVSAWKTARDYSDDQRRAAALASAVTIDGRNDRRSWATPVATERELTEAELADIEQAAREASERDLEFVPETEPLPEWAIEVPMTEVEFAEFVRAANQSASSTKPLPAKDPARVVTPPMTIEGRLADFAISLLALVPLFVLVLGRRWVRWLLRLEPEAAPPQR